MRPARLVSALVCAALLSAAAGGHAQDFDPRGRKKPGPKPGPRPPATAPGPSGPRPSAGTSPGASAESGASSTALIERYTRIVLAQPGAAFPLQRLAQLYRDRDGSTKALVADFEKRAAQAGGEQYAALVTLAGLHKLEGRGDDAVRAYERAIALKGDDATAIVALARALADKGDVEHARARYEQALKLQTVAAEREQTLRTLMALALDAKDWDGAKRAHEGLVKLQPTSLFVRGELGRELYSRGEYERAEGEFKDLVNAAAGDNRALAPALKDLGRAQAKAHKSQDAVATLRRALKLAGQEAAVRAEVYEAIADVYRERQELPVLIKEMESEHAADFPRVSLLASLYDEVGDVANAIATYRRALALSPRQIDIRVKLIRLLQAQGDLDKAIAEYDGLIRAAPNNPQFVFEQCEALLQRGNRARALALLSQLEARAHGEEEVLSRLADFYGRIGESERATRVLVRLTQVAAGDPSHLVDLGDRYFQEGNTVLAVQTWKRILTTVTPRARALSALGDVYLEHDMTAEALLALKEAVQLEPSNMAIKKQLAMALERGRNYREARLLWQDIGEKARQSGDKLVAREARSRTVTLWSLERALEPQVGPLEAQFRKTPPDVEAGRTLAEVYVHLRRLGEAEATLRRVLGIAPGDGDSYLALERVLVQENKLAEAIAVLEKLAQVEPNRARELYQRMAQYALSTYKDEDAITYAAKAVELNPDDADGHKRLGDMYRSRQDAERAIREYRLAIAKNDRLYPVYFALADLLLSRGEAEEADRLYRRIVRGATDDELVARAARLSMQINLGRGTLDSLERDLLPLAIGNPQRTLYRRLLVEIYGNLTFGFMQRVRSGSPGEAAEAKANLARIGARAVKPLLDALAEGDATEQRVAIDVLGYVANKNAGPPLFAFATSQANLALRTRAMVAAGALKDPALLGRYQTLLSPKRDGGAPPSDSVAVAAVWGLARMGDRRTVPMLRTALRAGTPEMKALAALGLGALGERAVLPEIVALSRGVEGNALSRGAAAYALGALGSEKEAPVLLTLAHGGDTLPRQMALLALAQMANRKLSAEATKGAIGAMADAVFAGSEGDGARAQKAGESVARAGTSALVIVTSPAKATEASDLFAVPDGPLSVENVLALRGARDASPGERALVLLRHGDAIERAALLALRTSSSGAHAVLDALSGPEGTFAPFVPTLEGADPAAVTRAKDLGRALEPTLLPLAQHPDPALRTKALSVLARSSADTSLDAVVAAVDDPNESVARVALAALGPHANARAVAAVAKVLDRHEAWAMRVLAAEALGRLGKSAATDAASRALETAASKDGYALVREAALKALFSVNSARAVEVAKTVAATDAEPRVRESARALAASRRGP